MAKLTERSGSFPAFAFACAMVVVWAALGPFFGWSDTWQLLINTPTTVITFLLLFVVQYTQNRADRAMHVKLDAIIAALEQADSTLMGLEDRPADEIRTRQREVQAVDDGC